MRSGFGADFREVQRSDIDSDCVAFEQTTPVSYGQQASDHLDDLVAGVPDRLWRIVSTDADQRYRKYYLHLRSSNQKELPQP